MADESKDGMARGLLIGFLAGSALGAVIALLYAPKSGKEMRKDIKDKASDIKDEVAEKLNLALLQSLRNHQRWKAPIGSDRDRRKRTRRLHSHRCRKDVERRPRKSRGRIRPGVKDQSRVHLLVVGLVKGLGRFL